jgi:hypothetical protein
MVSYILEHTSGIFLFLQKDITIENIHNVYQLQKSTDNAVRRVIFVVRLI